MPKLIQKEETLNTCRGNYKEAIKDYTRALEIDPALENTHYNRGIAKSNLKVYDEVVEDYTKELELNQKYKCLFKSRYNRSFYSVNMMKRLQIFQKFLN